MSQDLINSGGHILKLLSEGHSRAEAANLSRETQYDVGPYCEHQIECTLRNEEVFDQIAVVTELSIFGDLGRTFSALFALWFEAEDTCDYDARKIGHTAGQVDAASTAPERNEKGAKDQQNRSHSQYQEQDRIKY